MRLRMKSILILIPFLASCALAQVGGTAKAVRADSLFITHLAKLGNDTLATQAYVRTYGGGEPGTGDIEGIVTIWPVEGGGTSGTPTITFDTTGAYAYLKSLLALKLVMGDTTAIFTYMKSQIAGKQAAGTYLIPSDSTTQRTYSTSLYAPKISPVFSGTVSIPIPFSLGLSLIHISEPTRPY